MELSDKDIALIESYLLGNLSEGEQAEVTARMANDAAFAREVDIMRDVMGGAAAYGRNSLKATVAAIGSELTAAGALDSYEPTQNAPSNNPNPPNDGGASASGGSGKILSWLLVLGFAAGGWYAWNNGMIQEYFPKEIEQLYKVDTVRIDTIRREIKVPSTSQETPQAQPIQQQKTVVTTKAETTYTVRKVSQEELEALSKSGKMKGDTLYQETKEIEIEYRENAE